MLVVLLAGLVLRRVFNKFHLVLLGHVAVDGGALLQHGEVADLATVDVAHHHLKQRAGSLCFKFIVI